MFLLLRVAKYVKLSYNAKHKEIAMKLTIRHKIGLLLIKVGSRIAFKRSSARFNNDKYKENAIVNNLIRNFTSNVDYVKKNHIYSAESLRHDQAVELCLKQSTKSFTQRKR